MDLAAALIRAIEQHRDQLNAQAMPFVGRVTFHVDLDCNIAMDHVQVSTQPCRDPESQGIAN